MEPEACPHRSEGESGENSTEDVLLKRLTVLYQAPVPDQRIDILLENTRLQKLEQGTRSPRASRWRLARVLGARFGGLDPRCVG